MDYRRKLKEILAENGMTGIKLSEELGMKYGYFKKSTMGSVSQSNFWVRAFVFGYRLGKKYDKDI